MTRETKVGLIVGMGFILLVGIILSDFLSIHRQAPLNMTDFGPNAQKTLQGDGAGVENTNLTRNDSPVTPPGPGPGVVVKTPDELAGETRTAPPGGVARIGDVPTTVPPLKRVEMSDGTTPPAPPVYYFVQRGDDFAQVSNKYYGDRSFGSLIREANPSAVNPDGSLRVTAKLLIPPRPAAPQPSGGEQRFGQLPPPPVEPAPQVVKTVKVESGDTLVALATKYLGTGKRWPEILQANKDQIDKPEALRVGMTLKLPSSVTAPASSIAKTPGGEPSIFNKPIPASGVASGAVSGGGTYVVRSGDTLYSIASSKLGDGKLWKQLLDANHGTLKDPKNLAVGMKLILPQRT